MDIENLIVMLEQDNTLPRRNTRQIWGWAGIAGGVSVALLFASFIGPRADIAEVMLTPRFLFKAMFTGLLFVAAFVALARLMRPGASLTSFMAVLCAAPLVLFVVVMVELFSVSNELWHERLMGTHALQCLMILLLLALVPLGTFIWALRQGATTHPILSGTVAGIAAASLGGAFFTLNCPDDSPLFVAVWYTLSMLLTAFLGAFLGAKFLRW